MATSTNLLIKERTLNGMVDLAFRGQVVKEYSFNANVKKILGKAPSPKDQQATTAMKERSLALISGKGPDEEGTQNGQGHKRLLDQGATQCLQTRCHLITDQLHYDLILNIFLQCQAESDWESIGALACVNAHYNKCATAYWNPLDLKLFCSELTILDAKTQGITVDDEPCFSKLQILKWIKDLAPHVENNEGLTLLTMAKGLTLNQLVAIAANEEVTVAFGTARILKELGDVPVEQTYVILITNSIFKKSRNLNDDQHQQSVTGHGCGMPTVQEYVALGVFTNKFFQKRVYGEDLSIFGRSCTPYRGCSLIFGYSAPGRLFVSYSRSVLESIGAGGRRKI